MSARINPGFYHAEAAITDPAAACYIERPADAELLRALREGKYTVILSSRKVGKSSLIERGFETLRADGVLVARHELTVADASITPEDWYGGLVNGLVQDAHERNGFVVAPHWWQWWSDHSALPPGERFKDFLRLYLLESSEQPWVIAIDEIDTTIPLAFSDDFFAALRSCQNARGPQSAFRRLTFLLAGVATPSQLIKDNRRTPFNIGHYIQLTDFTAVEAAVFMDGLGEPRSSDHPAMQRVLHWTGGHPYLTQRIFQQLAERMDTDLLRVTSPDWPALVDAEVEASFLHPGSRSAEPHLEDIARRRIGDLDKPGSAQRNPTLKRAILATWRNALRGQSIRDDRQAPHLVELKLSGLLLPRREEPEQLVARNQIYRQVFDERWAAQEQPSSRAIYAAVAGSVLSLLAAVVGPLWFRIQGLEQIIAKAQVDVPREAHAQLRAVPGLAGRADRLLAQYWESRALRASVESPSDEAAVLWLQSLATAADPVAALHARRVWAGGLESVVLTTRHENAINHAEFSRDGAHFVTASQDKTARVWDAQTGQSLCPPLKHDDDVYYAEFSPDGQRIVTASEDGTARIWDVQTGQPLGTTLHHQGNVNHAEFSPDGQHIVTSSDDHTARIWGAYDGQPLAEPLEHNDKVNYGAYSPDGQLIVTTSDDGTAQIWDGQSGQPHGQPLVHRSGVRHAAFSSDGQRLVTSDSDGTAVIWDVQARQPLGAPLQHTGRIEHAEFSPDGQRIVTASIDDTVRIWDAHTGTPLGAPLHHEGTVNQAMFSPDGQRIVTASDDYTARIWDSNTSQPLGSPMQHESPVSYAAFSRDGQRILTTSDDNTARVWDPQIRQPLGAPIWHQGGIIHAAFSPDRQRIVTASSDSTARIWNAQTGQPMGAPLQHEDTVNHAAFSPNGRLIVTASDDHSARVWDSYTGQPLGSPLQHESWVRSAEFSPDGQRLVTSSTDTRIWEVQSGQRLGSPLKQYASGIAMFSPDGQRILTTSDVQTTALIWNVQTSQPMGKPLKHQGNIWHAAFSPDGQRLVTSDSQGFARTWDAHTGQPLLALRHESSVHHAVFSSDGHRIVTGDGDSARVFDAQTGLSLGWPLLHARPVYKVAFSDDGKRVLTQTQRTLTWWRSDDTGSWQPEATVWARGNFWDSEPVVLDGSGATLRMLDAWTGSTLLLREISPLVAEPGLLELPRPPSKLLNEALQRFGFRFEPDERGGIRARLQPRMSGDERAAGGARQPGTDPQPDASP